MVGIHLSKLVYLCTYILMSFRTFRTVTDALLSSFVCLSRIDCFLHAIFKDTDIKQSLIYFTAKKVFKDTTFIGYCFICIQLINSLLQL